MTARGQLLFATARVSHVVLTPRSARGYASITSCIVRDEMNSQTAAIDRLAEAVTRLEKATGDGVIASDAEAELVSLRDRCRVLEGRNAEVSRRLDAAIARLRTVLAE
jgi:hypothetical protein